MCLSVKRILANLGKDRFQFWKIGAGLTIVFGLLLACHPDGSDLQKSIYFYYSFGVKTQNNSKYTYKLISSKSKNQIDQEQWISINKNSISPSKIEVLRQEERQGTTYALIQLIYEKNDYQDIYTHTWVREDGKWRRLTFKRTAEESDRALSNGDFTNAIAKAEEWLALDPFSIGAYRNLGFAIERGGSGGTQGRTLNDITRAVIAINAQDTTANFLAATWTADPNVAKTFLKRLERTHSYAPTVFNLALKYRQASDRISFLDGQKDDPLLRLVRVQTLAQLGRWDECHKMLTNQGNSDNFKSNINSNDPGFGANYSAILGFVSLACDQTTAAQEWLDLGVSKDPNNPRVKILANVIGKPDKILLARYYAQTQF